jgi:hypothetical protein
MLNVTSKPFIVECHYAECCYAECRYAECRYAECRYAECRFAECRYTECRYTECRYAEFRGAKLMLVYATSWQHRSKFFVKTLKNVCISVNIQVRDKTNTELLQFLPLMLVLNNMNAH